MEVYDDELYHYGIKGMKWGVRRYQNADGTLTSAGKKRMYREQFDMESKERKELKKYTADTSRWVKEDMERIKRLTDSSKQLTNELKNTNDKLIKNAKRNQIDLSQMSDKELRDRINRSFLEKQYNDMFNPPRVSKGKEYVGKVLDNAGNALAITSTALGVALAIKELRG